MSVCSFANQSYRYDSRYPNSRYTGGPNKGVLHTTEGGSLPSYDSGAKAPHFTVRANMATKTVTIYQHFDTNRPARALQNQDGGVQTNNDGCIQIELIGSCSKSAAEKYGLLYWPEAPTWALDGLKKLMRWIEADRGIPRKSTTRPWLCYGVDPRRPGISPASYGYSTPARMTQTEWDNFAGWAGHMHVAENAHGDPGNINIAYLLTVAAVAPKKVVTVVGVTLAALATIFGITTTQLEQANPGIAPSLSPSATVTLPSGVNPTPPGATGVTKPVPTTTTTPAPAPTTTVRTLSLGMSGADVKALQVKLGVPADGSFGPKTDRAVRDFQYVKGLTADGKVGPATRTALGTGWVKPTVKYGATGRYVVVIQRRVGVPMDGKFGPMTRSAVIAWERRWYIAQDGVYGSPNWSKHYR